MTCDPDRPVTPAEIAAYCPACDPCWPWTAEQRARRHTRSCPAREGGTRDA